ncbi:hypothetical protein [Flagellimonas lutimaris]|uniref:hypothetical protein n=1 Tax=Flagellimonas lutimaris TaxID=475082 RepID=UPI003F5CF29E
MVVKNSFLIFKSDFKHRTWLDWIQSNIVVAPPPFHYKGSITFNASGITFVGYDIFHDEEIQFNIPKEEIEQLYYGYDDTFKTFNTQDNENSWAPIRFKFAHENDLYLISEFNGIYSANEELFEELKMWLS